MMRSISASVLPNRRTASRAARRLPSAVCCVGRRLLDIALRHRARREQIAQARQILAVQFLHARGRDQRRLGLQQIRAVDGEQRLPLLDVVADRGEQRNDPSLIGREDLDRQFFIEVDAADGLLFDREIALLDRLDLHGIELDVRADRRCPSDGARGLARRHSRSSLSLLPNSSPDRNATSNRRGPRRQRARRRPPHSGDYLSGGEPSLSRIQRHGESRRHGHCHAVAVYCH